MLARAGIVNWKQIARRLNCCLIRFEEAMLFFFTKMYVFKK